MPPNTLDLQDFSATPRTRLRRPLRIATAVAAILGTLAAPAALAQSSTDMASQLKALQDQIQQLQRQLNELQAKQAAQSAATQQPPAPPAAQAAPSSATTAPVVHAGPVNVTFGGFTALESVYRDHNETADIGSNYNTSIPFPYQANDHVSEFRESARQSRLSILAQTPRSGSYSAEGYLESDFLSAGASSNSAESNSYTLRVRHFYGLLRDNDAGWYLLAGQNWSLATLYANAQLAPRSERIPQTIDAQYVVGFNWTRDPQLRWVKSWGNTMSLGFSVESPQASFYSGCSGVATPAPAACGAVSNITTNAGGSLFASNQNYSIDFAPDFIGKFAFDPGYGHYEVYMLARGFRDRSPGTAAGTNNTAWGVSGGGGLILPLAGPALEFQLSGLAGSGNGRYGSAQLPDATIKPDGTVATIDEVQLLGGLLFKPTPLSTYYLYYGFEQASKTAYANAAGTVGYGYGSELYNNSGCDLLTGSAGTCIANTKTLDQLAIGSWWKVYQGDIGNFQIGLQYSYTKRKTFAGVGGDPSTDINMGFVSFRFYPYQR